MWSAVVVVLVVVVAGAWAQEEDWSCEECEEGGHQLGHDKGQPASIAHDVSPKSLLTIFTLAIKTLKP